MRLRTALAFVAVAGIAAAQAAGQSTLELSQRIQALESLSCVGALVIGGLFVTLFLYAKRRARKEIAKLVQGDVLPTLIYDREKGRRLRAEAEILVVAGTGDTGSLLFRLGFKRAVTVSPDEARTRLIALLR